MLTLNKITKKFNTGTPDENTVFDGFDFEIEKGDFISVIGSNGSGKSTLLNLICGSLEPDSGEILLDGKNINKLAEHKRSSFIGRVHQSPQLGTCGNLTILENLALADNKNKLYGLSPCISKKRLEYYKSILETCNMGLENRLGTKAGALSGGQRQALALVIASMSDIRLLILDEHTAALDPKSSETIMKLTDKIVSEKQITTIMVTHNLRYAAAYGNRLVMLHSGRCITDICGEDKKNADVDAILDKFYHLSIENGN